jgi:hypothetical protein
VTKGGGIARTKHLRARMNLGREVVDENRALVEYVKAEDMKADGFSKPLDPSGHGKFMPLLHNWVVRQRVGGMRYANLLDNFLFLTQLWKLWIAEVLWLRFWRAVNVMRRENMERFGEVKESLKRRILMWRNKVVLV